jgi:hypothetical protein
MSNDSSTKTQANNLRELDPRNLRLAREMTEF